jgi:hypothetical protein
MRSPIATGADEWEFFFQQVWRRAPPALRTPPSAPHLAPKVGRDACAPCQAAVITFAVTVLNGLHQPGDARAAPHAVGAAPKTPQRSAPGAGTAA